MLQVDDDEEERKKINDFSGSGKIKSSLIGS